MGLWWILTLSLVVSSVAASPSSTGPSSENPAAIVRDYLAAHAKDLGLESADLAEVVVLSQDVSEATGVTHVYLRQRLAQIEVFGGEMNATVARDGSVVSLHHSFVPRLAAASNGLAPRKSAVQAAVAAAHALGLEVTRPIRVAATSHGPAWETTLTDGGFAVRAIDARLVHYPVDAGRLRLAWLLDIEETGGQHLWDAIVDAETGELLEKIDHVAADSSASVAPVVPVAGERS